MAFPRLGQEPQPPAGPKDGARGKVRPWGVRWGASWGGPPFAHPSGVHLFDQAGRPSRVRCGNADDEAARYSVQPGPDDPWPRHGGRVTPAPDGSAGSIGPEPPRVVVEKIELVGLEVHGGERLGVERAIGEIDVGHGGFLLCLGGSFPPVVT